MGDQGSGIRDTNEIRSTIQQAAQAWMTGDANAFANLFAPNGEFITPGRACRGQDAIREVTASFAARHSNVNISIMRIIIDGDQAVVEWQWQDTDDATGVRHRADDAIVIDFNDGLIARWREYIDNSPYAALAK